MSQPASAASWSRAELAGWLARHPDALEPGLRWLEPLPESLRAAGADAAGADPLGRPALAFVAEAERPDEAVERALAFAGAALADPGLCAPWFGRPREPRLLLVAPEWPAASRARLTLLAQGLPLRAWAVQAEGKAVERPRFVCQVPPPLEHPLAQAPAAPATAQARLRRLIASAAQLRPRLTVTGAGWPLVFSGARGPCAAVHRDGEELVFVAAHAARRAESLRLDQEEDVDRALDALLREQFAAAGV